MRKNGSIQDSFTLLWKIIWKMVLQQIPQFCFSKLQKMNDPVILNAAKLFNYTIIDA